ncbi:proline dehydrogenase 2, mitochondrial [Dorcoceras hygrometricum]|uniref:Proline dehydrogenase 2, mitochondrial n=1 Tax=Dorcoceras hygrometricum TaxID=472368 RepID=A0A2Z7BP72_9LAMI|nr:proline dehydrogenase 2, mitochondrial [Dorcoceras hygrometricum]
MSDRVSCLYFRLCVLVGSSSNVDVDFKHWYFSCDGQQMALRDSEATTFCEQELNVGFGSVFLSRYRNYVVLISWNDNVLGVTFSFLVDWAVKMRIRPPELETSICDAKYHVSLLLAAPLPFSQAAAVLATPPPPPPLAGICSDQLFEKNPSALISSGLLVQADEGVSHPVVDLIDESTSAYHEAPDFFAWLRDGGLPVAVVCATAGATRWKVAGRWAALVACLVADVGRCFAHGCATGWRNHWPALTCWARDVARGRTSRLARRCAAAAARFCGGGRRPTMLRRFRDG